MAKGISICKGCGNNIPTEESKVYSGKKYCNKCYDLKLQEKLEYDELLKNICKIYDIDIPTGMMLKHIKDYKEQFNYTYSGMSYTLYYCNDIKGLKFDVKYGIGIVKYEYENAKDYFIQQQKIQESITNTTHEEKIREVKVNLKKQNKKIFLVNIDELVEGGDE